MASTPDVGAVVVGGGIAGLAAALRLQRDTPEVVVVDASDRPGGVMRTDHEGGYVIERGPNTFLVNAPMLEEMREQGMEGALLRAQPASRRRLVFHRDRLRAVPMSPLGFMRTSLLSHAGKVRLLREPLVRRGGSEGESVAEFAARRFGEEAVTNLVGPFLTGVYAGDERRLSAEAVFPGLVELERKYGSVVLGGLLQALSRRGKSGLHGTHSSPEGLGPFARLLTRRLNEPPALRARVSGLRRDGASWCLSIESTAGPSEVRAARVVLATPAREAAQLLEAVEGRAAELLAGIEYAPIVGVPLGVDPTRVREKIDGFGFLAPRDSGMRLLGCLYMSRLFPGRAPNGRELLQCLVGGLRWPEAIDEPDDTLVARLEQDLDRALGLEERPEALSITRWPRAIPQPGADHVRRIREVRERVASLGGLALAGSYLDGVSVPDTYTSGLRAATSP